MIFFSFFLTISYTFLLFAHSLLFLNSPCILKWIKERTLYYKIIILLVFKINLFFSIEYDVKILNELALLSIGDDFITSYTTHSIFFDTNQSRFIDTNYHQRAIRAWTYCERSIHASETIKEDGKISIHKATCRCSCHYPNVWCRRASFYTVHPSFSRPL